MRGSISGEVPLRFLSRIEAANIHRTTQQLSMYSLLRPKQSKAKKRPRVNHQIASIVFEKSCLVFLEIRHPCFHNGRNEATTAAAVWPTKSVCTVLQKILAMLLEFC